MSIGEKLDSLLSTVDSGFNHAMQSMVWKHTPKGKIVPDAGIVQYMEILHEVFFFCYNNYKTPYACIVHITDTADTDEYLLCLVDSILHLISQSDKGKEMEILWGQLIDFRHQIAPWDEDEGVKRTMEEMENENSLLYDDASVIIQLHPDTNSGISVNEKTNLADYFEHTSKYNLVMELLVENGYCMAGTYVWIDKGVGHKAMIIQLIRHLHAKGFFKKNKLPTAEKIIAIALNTFGVEIGERTAKNTEMSSYFDFIKPASVY